MSTTRGVAEVVRPRHVILFTGHMVDAPARSLPRFPAEAVPAAAKRIATALDTIEAGPADLALTQGAAGGDVLFAEACLARRVPLRLMLPLAEPEFVARSLLPVRDGEAWLARFRAIVARLDAPPREAPRMLGPLIDDEDPFVRGNRWLLETALGFGADRLRCICLWNGGGGDGPGGTRHLVDAVRAFGGEVQWIDTRELS